MAQNKQQASYNRFVKNRAIFKVGDIVKINNFRTRVGYSKAFEHKFLGPYRVTKILGDLNYQLVAENLATQIVHYNRMLHFNVRTEFLVEKQVSGAPATNILVPLNDSGVIKALPINFIYNLNLRKRTKHREEQLLLGEFERLSRIENYVDNQILHTKTLRRSVRLAKAAGSAAVVSNEAGLENDNFLILLIHYQVLNK